MLIFKDNKLIHETQVRVTYRDTDKMGYSYYGNYPTYYEIGRTEFIRELGITYKKLEDDGFLLPIIKMDIKYLAPAKYDDLLTVKTIYAELHSVKLEFNYEIYNQNQKLLNKGYTLLAFVNANTRKPTKAPDYYINTINRFLKK